MHHLSKKATGMLALACFGIATFAGPAGATWSIVGVDADTGEVGVAIASCVPVSALGDVDRPLEPVALAPGRGAGVSQALVNSDAPPEMARLLNDGATADDVIAAVIAPAFDADSAERQHAVVTVDGAAAGFTGENNESAALDRQGDSVSAQGNILVADAVVDDALQAFVATEGELGERLIAALVAGSEAGGDSRCDADQTALFAHLAVAGANDDPAAPSVVLTRGVVDGDGRNPVTLLAADYESGARQGSDTPSLLEEFGGVLLTLAVIVVALVVMALVGWRWWRRSRAANI